MKALSLFSGCGGMDIGVERSGFKTIASIEIDKHAANSLQTWRKTQNSNGIIINDDINNINPSSFPKNIDLLYGGPPCQAFSLIGKRNSLLDSRGQLLFQIVRFASTIKPRVILLEQVKGLLSAKDENNVVGGAFDLFLRELEKIGYASKWLVINVADYGLPQKRERLFLVATKGINKFIFPRPTHTKNPEQALLFPLLPHEVVKKYLSDLPMPTGKNEAPIVKNHVDITPNRDRERISYVPQGSYLAIQKAPKDIIMNLTKKDSTKFRRLSFDEPSLTLRGGEIFYHPVEDRYLTPREYLRLHTFPDSYELMGPIRSRSGTYTSLDQHRQVANAVPPKIAEILSKEILNLL